MEVASDMFASSGGEVRHLVRTQNQLRQRLEAVLGVTVTIRLVEPSSRGERLGNTRRVVDHREERR